MAESKNQTFAECLAFKSLGENKWATLHPPQRMGNAANIAYGGFALAVAAQASCLTVPEGYYLYSLVGNFLGPALTDRPLLSSTRLVRKTRTFCTVQVEVTQQLDSGEERSVLVALGDFMAQEKGVVLEFSAPPRRKYSPPSSLGGMKEIARKLVEEGKIAQKTVDAFATSFAVMSQLFETRPCPEGIFGQNMNGVAKGVPTTQDGLHVTKKSTAEWARCCSALPPALQMTALAFYMDGALSFAPLSFSHMYLEDSAACSSLDFALRVFTKDVDISQWCLKEIITHAGAEGRTYSEGRLWDQEGRMVACMTQQSILRAWPEGAKAAKGKL